MYKLLFMVSHLPLFQSFQVFPRAPFCVHLYFLFTSMHGVGVCEIPLNDGRLQGVNVVSGGLAI